MVIPHLHQTQVRGCRKNSFVSFVVLQLDAHGVRQLFE
jgi:hypothetical protein